ncbi:hypothetical protein BJX65DRAFT_198142 [Aspergillus insuetus]
MRRKVKRAIPDSAQITLRVVARHDFFLCVEVDAHVLLLDPTGAGMARVASKVLGTWVAFNAFFSSFFLWDWNNSSEVEFGGNKILFKWIEIYQKGFSQ